MKKIEAEMLRIEAEMKKIVTEMPWIEAEMKKIVAEMKKIVPEMGCLKAVEMYATVYQGIRGLGKGIGELADQRIGYKAKGIG